MHRLIMSFAMLCLQVTEPIIALLDIYEIILIFLSLAQYTAYLQ